jgi:hypothetical protein
VAVSVHRVVVRGHFADLTSDQRAALLAEAGDHGFDSVTYTEWGTFIYEPNLVAFNFRYEVRIDDEASPRPDPVAIGIAKAEASMRDWGLATKHVTATSTDMSDMWRE